MLRGLRKRISGRVSEAEVVEREEVVAVGSVAAPTPTTVVENVSETAPSTMMTPAIITPAKPTRQQQQQQQQQQNHPRSVTTPETTIDHLVASDEEDDEIYEEDSVSSGEVMARRRPPSSNAPSNFIHDELEALRVRQLAKNLRKDLQQAETKFSSPPLASVDKESFYMKQKEQKDAWKKKQEDSRHFLASYRGKVDQADKVVTKTNRTFDRKYVASEMDAFYLEQKRLNDELKRKQRDAHDFLHSYRLQHDGTVAEDPYEASINCRLHSFKTMLSVQAQAAAIALPPSPAGSRAYFSKSIAGLLPVPSLDEEEETATAVALVEPSPKTSCDAKDDTGVDVPADSHDTSNPEENNNEGHATEQEIIDSDEALSAATPSAELLIKVDGDGEEPSAVENGDISNEGGTEDGSTGIPAEEKLHNVSPAQDNNKSESAEIESESETPSLLQLDAGSESEETEPNTTIKEEKDELEEPTDPVITLNGSVAQEEGQSHEEAQDNSAEAPTESEIGASDSDVLGNGDASTDSVVQETPDNEEVAETTDDHRTDADVPTSALDDDDDDAMPTNPCTKGDLSEESDGESHTGREAEDLENDSIDDILDEALGGSNSSIDDERSAAALVNSGLSLSSDGDIVKQILELDDLLDDVLVDADDPILLAALEPLETKAEVENLDKATSDVAQGEGEPSRKPKDTGSVSNIPRIRKSTTPRSTTTSSDGRPRTTPLSSRQANRLPEKQTPPSSRKILARKRSTSSSRKVRGKMPTTPSDGSKTPPRKKLTPKFESPSRLMDSTVQSRSAQRTQYISPRRFHYSPKRAGGIPQYTRPIEKVGDTCNFKWMLDLHSSRAGCERCLHFASTEEILKFQTDGHHYRINKVRGGCCRSCAIFPRTENEPAVRLCRKCFYDTHRHGKA